MIAALILGYLVVAGASFFGLSWFWFRRYRPGYYKWEDNQIVNLAAMQGLMWPLFLVLYIVWGSFILLAQAGRKSRRWYVRLMSGQPKDSGIDDWHPHREEQWLDRLLSSGPKD